MSKVIIIPINYYDMREKMIPFRDNFFSETELGKLEEHEPSLTVPKETTTQPPNNSLQYTNVSELLKQKIREAKIRLNYSSPNSFSAASTAAVPKSSSLDPNSNQSKLNDLIKYPLIQGNSFHPRGLFDLYQNIHKSWPSTSSFSCHYCCHPFEGPPIPRVKRIINKKNFEFEIENHYCSVPCMLRSIIDQPNPFNLSEQFTNNIFFVQQITPPNDQNTSNSNIQIAPPRDVLSTFGGWMSIEEFRQASIQDKQQYNLIVHPLCASIPFIEELRSF